MPYSIKKYLSGYKEYFDAFRNYGVAGLLEEFRIRSTFWNLYSLSQLDSKQPSGATSITDRPGYLEICRRAATDDACLANFKRCHEYRLVLEHVTRSQGQQYLKIIEGDTPILRNMLEVVPKEIGNPVQYEYPFIGTVSPTQIRYAKIVKDLEFLFGKNSFEIVVEVGVGNGGQAWQIANYFHPDKYLLVDLPEVLALTARTGSLYNFTTEFQPIAPNDISVTKTDLFISNYAFSELKKKTQEQYLEAYISHSKRGYMLYNHIHENQQDSYTVDEISAMIPGSRIMEESPITYKGNCLLVWG